MLSYQVVLNTPFMIVNSIRSPLGKVLGLNSRC